MLPKTFKYSPKITFVCIPLAAVMIWCSTWQWDRYKQKLELVETYSEHSETEPLPFPKNEDFRSVVDRRVQLSGTYDYQHEVIVLNQKHETGPGYWLLTPMKVDGREKAVMVSRGFIPFADRDPESWEKYRFVESETIDAVAKENVASRMIGPGNPEVGPDIDYQRKWFYPEISKMAQQLPYPLSADVYVQRIGKPQSGLFPAESIRIEVPPQTHFGYTIEWALLALATLLVGFMLQAYPRRRHAEREPHSLSEADEERMTKH